MSVRRKSQVKRLVESEYSRNPLYGFIRRHYTVYETELTTLHLCPEELFLYIMRLVDDIKEQGTDYEDSVPGLWDDVLNDLRGYAEGVGDDELCLATDLILMLLVTILFESEYSFHNDTLCTDIFQGMYHRSPKAADHRHELYAGESVDDALRNWICMYLDSEDDWLSDDMEKSLSAKKTAGDGVSRNASRMPKRTTESFKVDFDTEEAKTRLSLLYRALMNRGCIDDRTKMKTIIELFTGQDVSGVVVWLNTKGYLYSLIKCLMDRNLITCSRNKQWRIVESHFVDKKHLPFNNIRCEREGYLEDVNNLAELLDPLTDINMKDRRTD